MTQYSKPKSRVEGVDVAHQVVGEECAQVWNDMMVMKV